MSYFPAGTDLSFKSPNENAYQRYRVFFQILDLIHINAETSFMFCKRSIVASLLYCVVGGPHMIGAFPYEY